MIIINFEKTGNIPVLLYTTSIFLQLFRILSQFQHFRIFYPIIVFMLFTVLICSLQ